MKYGPSYLDLTTENRCSMVLVLWETRGFVTRHNVLRRYQRVMGPVEDSHVDTVKGLSLSCTCCVTVAPLRDRELTFSG